MSALHVRSHVAKLPKCIKNVNIASSPYNVLAHTDSRGQEQTRSRYPAKWTYLGTRGTAHNQPVLYWSKVVLRRRTSYMSKNISFTIGVGMVKNQRLCPMSLCYKINA